MYPLGLLFGLGFDTATEVALLVLAGGAAGAGLPFYAILCLPILFAAGMSLLDTIDGSFMNFAYGWAFSKPVRKVYYNITITGLSVAVALVIGTIELRRPARRQLEPRRRRSGAGSQSIDLNTARLRRSSACSSLTWAVALAVWRFGRIEERWGATAREVTLAGRGRAARSCPARRYELVVRRGMGRVQGSPLERAAPMCLAIPGQVVEVVDEQQPARHGRGRRRAAHGQHRPARRRRHIGRRPATGC